jgi:F-actin capping protein alpha subunit
LIQDLKEMVAACTMAGILDAFVQHNMDQLITVKHTAGHSVILCHEGQLEDGKFLDPKTQTAMTVDQMRLVGL